MSAHVPDRKVTTAVAGHDQIEIVPARLFRRIFRITREFHNPRRKFVSH